MLQLPIPVSHRKIGSTALERCDEFNSSVQASGAHYRCRFGNRSGNSKLDGHGRFFQTLVEEQGGVAEAFAALAGDVPARQFFTPEDVAKTVLYLVSDESLHLTGVGLVWDRG